MLALQHTGLGAGLVVCLGYAEIKDLDRALESTDDVVRADIPVDDSRGFSLQSLPGVGMVQARAYIRGDTQDQGSLQIITNYIDFGQPAPELVSTPRYCTEHLVGSFSQPPPKLGSLTMGTKTDPKVIEDLKSRGHRIELNDFFQMRTVIVINPETGLLHGAGDPKAPIPRHAAAL